MTGFAHQLLHQMVPVLVFLVSITVVAEVADAAGVFELAGWWAARVGRGRVWLLWSLVVVLACVCTIVLSLDTTAVLLTPAVLRIARQLRLSPVPFAMATVWLANTASLLLPVSNLSNLLALHRLGPGEPAYLTLAWRPALVAVLCTVAVLAVFHRRALRGHYDVPAPPQPGDPVLQWSVALAILALIPCFVTGASPAVPATAAAVAALALLALLAVRHRAAARHIRLPARLITAIAALLVLAAAIGHSQLGTLLGTTMLTGDGALGHLTTAAAGAVLSNLVNNLPAYLALEPLASQPHQLMALLVGVNVGPVVTVWGSVATLLWWQRCRDNHVQIPRATFAGQGLVLLLCTVTAAALAT